MSHARLTASLAVLSLALIACGEPLIGPETTDQVAASELTEPSTSVTSAPVTMLTDVRPAVVYIAGQGTFADGMGGEIANVFGTGTGFAIDSSGLVLTNNHVVTGAAFLDVWVDGETVPRNARVVGVSECSDLALIDVDGDVDLWLDFYTGEITPGQDVFAAGFPLSDPEYALTSGVVSRAPRPGNSVWASVSHEIEHTARTLPGNSGGPLLTPTGEVLGVVYAGNSDTDQQFAVGRDEVLLHLDTLREGENVTSLGLNGEAITFEGGSGVFVRSVASGSPAATVGVEAGDLVTRLEGIDLAQDGSMDSYCRILRSHDADDALAIEVFRPGSGELLSGTINVASGALKAQG